MDLPLNFHNRPPKVLFMTVAGTLVTIGVMAWIAITLLNAPRNPTVVANNISRNFRACLINDQHDSAIAVPVWSSLQKATSGAAVNVQHIQIPKSNTAESQTYVGSLVQRHCGLIISVGPDLHDAMTAAARNNPHQRFVVVGSPIKLANVRSFPLTDQSAVVRAVQQAADPRPSPRT